MARGTDTRPSGPTPDRIATRTRPATSGETDRSRPAAPKTLRDPTRRQAPKRGDHAGERRRRDYSAGAPGRRNSNGRYLRGQDPRTSLARSSVRTTRKRPGRYRPSASSATSISCDSRRSPSRPSSSLSSEVNDQNGERSATARESRGDPAAGTLPGWSTAAARVHPASKGSARYGGVTHGRRSVV
jgi:hypothetical protein